ncbi:MAG TPA: YchE family NAAT transporter [Rhodocyclaceae bacterium]
MLEFTAYTKTLIGLLAVLNPLGAVPIFVAMTPGASDDQRREIARVVVIAVTLILLAALVFGEVLLDFFGISINSFRVGGGILILLMAISMLQAKVSGTVHTEAEKEDSGSKSSVAVVPLATPLLAGPGAISTVILYADRGSGAIHYTLIAVDILLLCALLWLVFKALPWISRHISQTGINIFTRIMGLILAALSIEFIASGLKGLFPALA